MLRDLLAPTGRPAELGTLAHAAVEAERTRRAWRGYVRREMLRGARWAVPLGALLGSLVGDAELTTGTDEDPRRRALGHFKPRPPEPSASPAGLRSMTGPPPAKPPAIDLAEQTHERQHRRPRSVGGAPASVTRRTPRREVDSTGDSPFGSARRNLREIQFFVSPQLSGALSDRAEHEDVVLGEVVMAAVRRLPVLVGAVGGKILDA